MVRSTTPEPKFLPSASGAGRRHLDVDGRDLATERRVDAAAHAVVRVDGALRRRRLALRQDTRLTDERRPEGLAAARTWCDAHLGGVADALDLEAVGAGEGV